MKNLINEIKWLQLCLFFAHLKETGQKQGKIADTESFSADLPTETVDFFSLASGPISLQRDARIND